MPESGEHERREEQDVVREEDVVGRPHNRRGLYRLREEVLRVGQREGLGVEDRRVPVVPERSEIAVGERPQMVDAPVDDEAVEQRIAAGLTAATSSGG